MESFSPSVKVCVSPKGAALSRENQGCEQKLAGPFTRRQ